MEADARIRRAIREQAARERQRLGEPPDPEAVLAFVEGRLEGAERERVEDAIAAFPEVARLARDLACFPDLTPRGEEPAAELDATVLWRRIEAGAAARPLESTPSGGAIASRSRVLPALVRSRRRGGVPWWPAVAAALVGAILGIAGQRLADRGVPQPNPEILTLMPRGEEVIRGGAGPVAPADLAGGLVLVLGYAGPAEADGYALTLFDAGGRRRWSTRELVRRADGSFAVSIPPGFLGSERYTLELYHVEGAQSPPLAAYDLDLGPRSGD